jgi:small subunit ribosomal protein S8
MQHDPLSDALVQIRNAELTGHGGCELKPSSKLLGRILGVLQEEGYIATFEFVEDGKAGAYRVGLAGKINRCGSVRPRFPVRLGEIVKFEERYLPAQDFGVLILSTTKGVMTNRKAKELGIGGRLLAYVY